MKLTRYRESVDTHAAPVGRVYGLIRESWRDKSLKTSYGFTLAGDPTTLSAEWEIEERRAFLDSLKDHDLVVDIGANVGFYSCLAATHGKPVIAIEPAPRYLRYLMRNLWDNGLLEVEVFPLGLDARSGLRMLYGYGGIASFVTGWGQSKHGEIVPVTTLDTILAGRFDGQKILIKADVEGFELNVLRGAANTLARNPRPTWLMEVLSTDQMIPGGRNLQFDDTFKIFRENQYQSRVLDNKNFMFWA